MGGVAFSLAVRQALAVANGIRAELGHERINPSHLLAALAGRGSGKGVQALRDAGITEEGVLELIRQQQQGE
jgi:ATP-dependent Clp protease ATP-binding subunit ClpA